MTVKPGLQTQMKISAEVFEKKALRRKFETEGRRQVYDQVLHNLCSLPDITRESKQGRHITRMKAQNFMLNSGRQDKSEYTTRKND